MVVAKIADRGHLSLLMMGENALRIAPKCSKYKLEQDLENYSQKGLRKEPFEYK